MSLIEYISEREDTWFNIALSVSAGSFFKDTVVSLMSDIIYPFFSRPFVRNNVHVNKFLRAVADLVMSLLLSVALYRAIRNTMHGAIRMEVAVKNSLRGSTVEEEECTD